MRIQRYGHLRLIKGYPDLGSDWNYVDCDLNILGINTIKCKYISSELNNDFIYIANNQTTGILHIATATSRSSAINIGTGTNSTMPINIASGINFTGSVNIVTGVTSSYMVALAGWWNTPSFSPIGVLSAFYDGNHFVSNASDWTR